MDIVGKTFGDWLCVEYLGYLSRPKPSSTLKHYYKFSCKNCGKSIEEPIYYIIRKQDGKIKKKCRCSTLRSNAKDWTGERICSLTVTRLRTDLAGTPVKKKWPNTLNRIWECRCDCGEVTLKNSGNIRSAQYEWLHHGMKFTCGNSLNHPELHLCYPETPSILPSEVWDMLKKHLPKITRDWWHCNHIGDKEDELNDRVLRSCWIIHWKRTQGIVIDEKKESAIIDKYIRLIVEYGVYKRTVDTVKDNHHVSVIPPKATPEIVIDKKTKKKLGYTIR